MIAANGHRLRFTRAIVRTLDNESLVDAYQKSHAWKAVVEAGLIEPGAREAAKGRKQHAVLRAELLSRGFDATDVDYAIDITDEMRAQFGKVETVETEAIEVEAPAAIPSPTGLS